MTSRELADIFGVSKRTVLNVLKRNDCKIRSKNHNLPDRTSKITKELMEDLYLDKRMKIKDIAELLNVDVRTINRAKNKYNLKRI